MSEVGVAEKQADTPPTENVDAKGPPPPGIRPPPYRPKAPTSEIPFFDFPSTISYNYYLSFPLQLNPVGLNLLQQLQKTTLLRSELYLRLVSSVQFKK